MIKRDDKAVRKPKGKRAQETQILGIMPTSQKKKGASEISMIKKKDRAVR
jgi:hypothetical protein